MPEEPGFLAVIASVSALVLPLPGSVKNQLVLCVEFIVVELTAAPIADEFRQELPVSGLASLLINSRRRAKRKR